jgi:saccharopine dehydrogenase-like NADP-dependent oxidoreductase
LNFTSKLLDDFFIKKAKAIYSVIYTLQYSPLVEFHRLTTLLLQEKNPLAKQSVLVLGAGKIGSLITCLLADCGDYDVYLGNLNLEAADTLVKVLKLDNVTTLAVDAQNETQLLQALADSGAHAIISSLPFYCNPLVADIAARQGVHYFDLTEDVAVTEHVKKVSQNKPNVFMPQCGLAPGFISIAAHSVMENFEEIHSVKMRVGALPVNPNNALKYSLTWSTDGLINEYGNLCYGIKDSELTTLMPLEGYETITLDGVLYEAFNTSGGLGTLADTYAGKVQDMNYKTMRYPGHCKQIKLLMEDLKLNQDRDTLKRILENAIPKTLQDVVLIYVAVNGLKQGDFFEENYVKKVYPATINDKLWSSIQVTTATGVCSVFDIIMQDINAYHGFVTQESIELDSVVSNRFGKYYA